MIQKPHKKCTEDVSQVTEGEEPVGTTSNNKKMEPAEMCSISNQGFLHSIQLVGLGIV